MHEVLAAKAYRRLADFVRQGWDVLEPGVQLVWSWHIDAICEHLEAVTHGEIRRLVINVPPGHMKSLLVSVFWPAWQWLRRPSWRSVFSAHKIQLSTRDSVKCRNLITSSWYQRSFEPEWKLSGDQNLKSLFENTRTGVRQSLSVGAAATGFRGDAVVCDDPLPADEHPSDASLEDVISWWDFQMSSRLNDLSTGVRVLIMQRLHERDLSGHILERGGYDHLCLPTEYDPGRRSSTSIGWSDPRTERGELLFPAKFPPAVVDEAKVDLGSYGYSGQHQQDPSPPAGGILKRWWWRFWYPAEGRIPRPVMTRLPDGTFYEHPQMALPSRMHKVAQSWDMAFKGSLDSDYVAGQVWGCCKADFFLLDQVHAQMDFVETKAAVREMCERWPKTSERFVEDKANGPAIVSELQHEVGGFIAVTPEGGKEARAHAVAPIIEAGNVYLPHPSLFPWVSSDDPRKLGLLEELTKFPKVAHDDRVDALTQALIQLRARGGSFLRDMVQM
jgi:predicted phage terminase large subunit-like protein